MNIEGMTENLDRETASLVSTVIGAVRFRARSLIAAELRNATPSHSVRTATAI